MYQLIENYSPLVHHVWAKGTKWQMEDLRKQLNLVSRLNEFKIEEIKDDDFRQG